jgi:hypothetical protein
MITIQKVTSNVQIVPRRSPDIYWNKTHTNAICYLKLQLRYHGKWLKLFKIFLRVFYCNQVHTDFDHPVCVYIFISLPLLCFPSLTLWSIHLLFASIISTYPYFTQPWLSVLCLQTHRRSKRRYCRLLRSYPTAVPVTSVRKLYPRMTEHGHKVYSSTKVGRFSISRSTIRL